jgi:CO dehydrogenase maturation factor
VAFIGKGGSGKSTISGTVARFLARNGWPVLALDVDTLPGMAYSLGAPPEAAPRLPLGLATVVQGKRGRYWKVGKGAGAAHLVDTYALTTPDGVRLLELGKLPGNVKPEVTIVFRHVVDRFKRPGWAMVGDLAAGTRQPVFGWSSFAPVRIAVLEPNAKGLITLRNLNNTATHVLVNKVRSAADVERVRSATGLPIAATVPWDPELAAAERRGAAPIEAAPEAAAVLAVRDLASWLEEVAR